MRRYSYIGNFVVDITHIVVNITRKYISRPTDFAVIYQLKSILKDLLI
jgi:hypothetical protein